MTSRLLRRWPLPQLDAAADKEERGRVLVVGGAPEMPGAVILAATAALRAGAGKLQIAAPHSIAQAVATTIPESLVIALPETKSGAVAAAATKQIIEKANEAQAVLIGPGMVDEKAVTRLMQNLLPQLERSTVIIDAAALACVKDDERIFQPLRGRVVLTPHAGEMAHMTGANKSAIMRGPCKAAQKAAESLRAIIALKGAETFIAAPHERVYCNRAGNSGLATSGSGDTLSGIIAGLAARGAAPLQAAVWGVHLHGVAGDKLAKRIGPIGFLARELLAEIPAVMSQLDGRKKKK